jgi:hypothetical protein
VEYPDEKGVMTQAGVIYECFSNPTWLAQRQNKLLYEEGINGKLQTLIDEKDGDVKRVLIASQGELQSLLEDSKYCRLCHSLSFGLTWLINLIESRDRKLTDIEIEIEIENATLDKAREFIIRGLKYEFGHDVLKHGTIAFESYSRAAELNDSNRDFAFGRCSEGEIGCTRNFELAVASRPAAVAQGNFVAMNNVGILRLKGRGVPQDEVDTVHYF